MPVPTFAQPDRTTQSGTAYPANIDAAIGVLVNPAGHFAAHQAATANMTVVVDAGKLGGTGQGAVSVGQQTTGTITAPTVNPRIDLIVIDSVTGAVSVVAGTEAASPVAPAVPVGKIAVARVALATTTTTITNALITDERILFSMNVAGPSHLRNIAYLATVNAKALTVARKTAALADPTTSTPGEIGFRNRTETVGDSVIRQITAAHGITAPNGATLGYVAILRAVTMSIASPCYVTDINHGRSANDTVIFTTGGALPTGLTPGTVYYILLQTADTYNVSATPGGTAINTSGTQSGVHTASYAEKSSIYIYECDNGTIRETGLIKQAILDESKLYNTVAISATADSANVLYTTTAMTNAAVRLTGRMDIATGAVAGEWDNEDTRIYLGEKVAIEEGIWVPELGGTATYIARYGRYTKIGRMVFVDFRISVNAIGTGSTTVISGLPYKMSSAQPSKATGNCDYFSGIATSLVTLIPKVGLGTSDIRFIGLAAAGTSMITDVAVFANNTEISGTIAYPASA